MNNIITASDSYKPTILIETKKRKRNMNELIQELNNNNDKMDKTKIEDLERQLENSNRKLKIQTTISSLKEDIIQGLRSLIIEKDCIIQDQAKDFKNLQELLQIFQKKI